MERNAPLTNRTPAITATRVEVLIELDAQRGQTGEGVAPHGRVVLADLERQVEQSLLKLRGPVGTPTTDGSPSEVAEPIGVTTQQGWG
jgi:hypothetical protein